MIPHAAANNHGSTLVLNLLGLVVFSMTAAIVYVGAKTQVKSVIYEMRSVQAQAIAEAGLEDAFHSLYQDSSWRLGFTNKSFAGGAYTVTLTAASPPVITATGYSSSILFTGPAVKTVSVAAVFVSTGISPKVVLTNDLTVNGTVDAYDPTVSLTPSSGSFTTGGTIWSNGDFVTSGVACPPVRVLSNTSYFQGQTAPQAACVTGTIDVSTYTLPLPVAPCGTCETINDNLTGITPSSAYNGGAQKLTVSAGETVTLAPGIYFFTQVFINGTGILNVDTSSGSVKIFYNNKWQESSSCAVNNLSKIPSRLLISDLTSGSHKVDLSCPAALHAYLEGTTTHFDLNSPMELYGHIISSEVTIDAGAKLHYDLGGGLTTTHVGAAPGALANWTESYQRQ